METQDSIALSCVCAAATQRDLRVVVLYRKERESRMNKKAMTWLGIGLSLLTFPAHAQSDTVDYGDVPAIIVGSGYGGSVAAYNLATADIPVLVLERGRWWSVTDPTADAPFPTAAEALNPYDGDSTTENGDPRVAWLRETCGGNLYSTFPPGADNCSPTTGLLEAVTSTPNPDLTPDLVTDGISALVASGVGGGSLVNNGVSFAPSKAAWDVAYPSADLPQMQKIWRDLNKTYYDVALKRLAPSAPPADVLASGYYVGTEHLNEFFAALGYPEKGSDDDTGQFNRTYAPVIVDWDAVRDELSGKRVASVINGEAWWGINSGAKRSLDTKSGYLGRAIRTGNVEVKALHTVTEIQYDSDNELYTVVALHTDEDYNVLEQVSYTTRHLIMAAGSIGTTKLLLRARDTGALPNLNSHLGTRFSTNGNVSGLTFVRPSTTIAEQGPMPQGGPAGVKVFDMQQADTPVTLENLPAPVPAFFADVSSYYPFLGAISTIGVGIPSTTGTFTYDANLDQVQLHWPDGAEDDVYDRIISIYSQHPGFLVDGEPFLTKEQAITYTLHPLGGVPIGLATDMQCALEGYSNLYAVDGSILPGATAAANPSATIAAMAERCMASITDTIHRDLLGY